MSNFRRDRNVKIDELLFIPSHKSHIIFSAIFALSLCHEMLPKQFKIGTVINGMIGVEIYFGMSHQNMALRALLLCVVWLLFLSLLRLGCR